jgi:hypothetical protein
MAVWMPNSSRQKKIGADSRHTLLHQLRRW